MMEAPDSPPEMQHVAPSSSQAQSSSSTRVNGETKVNHGAPGSSWNTKKFDEEYARAYNQLLDQNWDQSESSSLSTSFVGLAADGMIAKYGDVLLQ